MIIRSDTIVRNAEIETLCSLSHESPDPVDDCMVGSLDKHSNGWKDREV